MSIQFSLQERQARSIRARAQFSTHGLSKTKEYRAWKAMRARCCDSGNISYVNYGGRGVKVCEAWNSFESFFADMGKKPSDQHSLDRIDNNGNYEPGNVRWASRKEQIVNRRNALLVSYSGKSLSLDDWSKITGVRAATLWWRLYCDGQSAEQALTTPLRRRS